MADSESEDRELALIRAAVVRLRARILGVVLGMVAGVGLFLATAILLVKGGDRVGEHLQLLANYCPGYSVSWLGAFVGLFYGLLYGAAAGYVVARVYNFVANRRRR